MSQPRFLYALTEVVPDRRTRDEICQSIRDNAKLDTRFVLMNLLAAIVASYGLLANSTATVIGAMVIATLIGAISGIALALVQGDSGLLRQSLVATFAGVLIILAVSIPIGFTHRWMPLSSEILARTQPTILDLAIAIAGGAAGAFATVSPRVSAGLVGVAIATALVPPVAVCGICLAQAKWGYALGAMELFITNFAAIQLTTSVMMWMFGFRRANKVGWWQILLRNRHSIAVLLILGTVLSLNLVRTVRKYQLENQLRMQITEAIESEPEAELLQLAFEYETSKKLLVRAIIVTPQRMDRAFVARIKSQLPHWKSGEIDVKLLSILSSTFVESPAEDGSDNR